MTVIKPQQEVTSSRAMPTSFGIAIVDPFKHALQTGRTLSIMKEDPLMLSEAQMSLMQCEATLNTHKKDLEQQGEQLRTKNENLKQQKEQLTTERGSLFQARKVTKISPSSLTEKLSALTEKVSALTEKVSAVFLSILKSIFGISTQSPLTRESEEIQSALQVSKKTEERLNKREEILNKKIETTKNAKKQLDAVLKKTKSDLTKITTELLALSGAEPKNAIDGAKHQIKRDMTGQLIIEVNGQKYSHKSTASAELNDTESEKVIQALEDISPKNIPGKYTLLKLASQTTSIMLHSITKEVVDQTFSQQDGSPKYNLSSISAKASSHLIPKVSIKKDDITGCYTVSFKDEYEATEFGKIKTAFKLSSNITLHLDPDGNITKTLFNTEVMPGTVDENDHSIKFSSQIRDDNCLIQSKYVPVKIDGDEFSVTQEFIDNITRYPSFVKGILGFELSKKTGTDLRDDTLKQIRTKLGRKREHLISQVSYFASRNAAQPLGNLIWLKYPEALKSKQNYTYKLDIPANDDKPIKFYVEGYRDIGSSRIIEKATYTIHLDGHVELDGSVIFDVDSPVSPDQMGFSPYYSPR
jgi:hypothetical protein